ncbi:FAD-binding-3 domain-containing protein [Mycena venus]|uniref:FAD-binding-3 domain-containing protein n=1 Tax=Mycena venus TaxID=2733690 RepID=A0A8H7CR20_9AGAR|nr:FAD-binding-3 domain-containing protein [Mycena venus]
MSDLNSALNFIIVGASVSGLASAIALRSAGHNVLVLEKDPQLGGIGSIPNGSSCAQIPPNACKILVDWGLEEEIKAKSASIAGFSLYSYPGGQVPSPDHLGINRYDPEMLTEARGGYMQLAHRDLIRILHDRALKPYDLDQPNGEPSGSRISVIFGAEVVNVDCDACSVTLRSGEIHTADAIIGADGANGPVRRALMEEEDTSPESDVPTGMAAYSAIVPNALALDGIDWFTWSTLWLGPNRGLRTFPVGKENDVSLMMYTTDSSHDGTWTEEAEIKFTDVLGDCDQHIQKMVALAGPATCVQIKEPGDLECWVSESGRVLILGDAAHPLPPGSLHSYSISLEDGLFIGKIFSHTRNTDRVPEFLRAFQEHREPRCTRIRQIEKEYIFYITLPEGEMQAARDASLRERHAAGENALGGDLQQMAEDLRMVFGYDAADDADEWWVTWGRYHRSSVSSPG